jgi:uncharacterized OB-fold protein
MADPNANPKATPKTHSKRAAKKYVPKPEGLNLEFHEACLSNGLLNLQQCTACGEYRHPPRWYCPACHSGHYEFSPVPGSGSIYSMAINHFTVDPGWVDDLPYVTAVVQLDEGPRVVGAVRGLGIDDVGLGLPVQVTVEARGEEFAFLWVDGKG